MSDVADPLLRMTVQTNAAELSLVRARVSQQARQVGACQQDVDDVELAVSELATNVIRHTTACQFTIALGRAQGSLVLDVSNADHLTDLHTRLPAENDAPSGRGLAIVDAVMDAIHLVVVDGSQHIRCFKTLH